MRGWRLRCHALRMTSASTKPYSTNILKYKLNSWTQGCVSIHRLCTSCELWAHSQVQTDSFVLRRVDTLNLYIVIFIICTNTTFCFRKRDKLDFDLTFHCYILKTSEQILIFFIGISLCLKKKFIIFTESIKYCGKCSDLGQIRGNTLGEQMVCRHLKRVYLKVRRPTKRRKLLLKNRVARRSFVENYEYWKVHEHGEHIFPNSYQFILLKKRFSINSESW